MPLASNKPLWAALRAGEFSPDTLVRGALVAKRGGALADYTRAMLHAVWAEPADVHTAAGRRTFASSLGLPPDFWDRAAEPAIDAALKADIEDAVKRGVFGVPTFFVDGEIFFGNDRLDFVRRRLADRVAA